MKCFPHLNLTDIENFFYVVLPFTMVAKTVVKYRT